MSDNSKFYNHIIFLEHLIENYKDLLSKNLLEDLRIQLNDIKEKQQDKLLNISVVGDFSTGKSTFINALLKHNLLEMESMQSTTTASTIIEHENFYGIDIHKKGETKSKKSKNIIKGLFNCFFKESNLKKFDDLEALKNEIREFGASLEKSKDIEKINVYLPSPTLKGVFRIIDTPGLNALDAWLMDITKSTIEKISDASVIIIDANKILPKDFCDFIKSNLSNVLSQSVFVVTKLDQIRREKERNMVIEAIKNKIELEFKVKNPLILTYVSTEVLKSCGEEEGEINQDLLDISLKSEKKLLSFVKSKKKEAQTNKLVSMIERLYEVVSGHVGALQQNFQNKLDILLRSRQSDLKSFVAKQKDNRTREFMSTWSGSLVGYKNVCYDYRDQCVVAFLKEIDNAQCSSAQDLKAWCEVAFSQMATNLQNYMCEGLMVRNEYLEELDNYAIFEIQGFQEAFEEHFKEYGLLCINFDSSKLSVESFSQNSIGFENQRYILNQAVKDEDGKNNAGAAIGAFVGGFLLGPLGIFFGGGLGRMLAGFFGPSMYEIKSKLKDSLRPNLHRMFNQIAEDHINKLDRTIKLRCNFINQELDRYLSCYQSEVERRIEEQENKRKYIEEKINTIQIDLNDINYHKQEILNLI